MRDPKFSADKGYSRKDDRELLELFIPSVVIPKRGRLNKEEQARERQKPFRALRHQPAIESDINCLECHGLNRCPDLRALCRPWHFGLQPAQNRKSVTG